MEAEIDQPRLLDRPLKYFVEVPIPYPVFAGGRDLRWTSSYLASRSRLATGASIWRNLHCFSKGTEMSKRMKICLASALFAGFQVFFATATFAAGARGSEAEAEQMVKKAVALVKSAGPDSAYKTFTDHPDGAFKDRDLYVFVYDFQGNCLAQGANPKMIGKNLIDLKDIDGKQLIRGQIDIVKTRKAGWYGPYKFNNPVTNTLDTKKSYCEQGAGETMVCVGVYLEK